MSLRDLSTASATSVEAPTKHRTPAGHRVIHLVVPESTFVHVHKQALESGMRFSQYMNKFLLEAFPYSSGQGSAS